MTRSTVVQVETMLMVDDGSDAVYGEGGADDLDGVWEGDRRYHRWRLRF